LGKRLTYAKHITEKRATRPLNEKGFRFEQAEFFSPRSKNNSAAAASSAATRNPNLFLFSLGFQAN